MSTNVKILCMDWLSKFHCVGGTCPLTCCANWRIPLTDQDLINYKKMKHPFAKEFLSMIDLKKKCMKIRNGACQALTEDGWCRLVRECGEEYLSSICSRFPRVMNQYGDVLEGTVEIACPIVAGYLLEPEMITFEFTEEKIDKPIKEIDYQIYDSLSSARTYLIETIQASPSQYVSGKVSMIFHVLFEIQKLLPKNQLNLRSVSEILNKYDSVTMRNTIFTESEIFAKRYEEKGEIIQKVLAHLRLVLKEQLFPKLNLWEQELQQDLEIWLSDPNCFVKNLERFAEYHHQTYPLVADNFLVYILFLNWNTIDSEQFGHLFSAKFLEWTLIQTIAMSVWRKSGKIAKEEYEMIIATIDRLVSHSSPLCNDLANLIQIIGKDRIENILLVLI